MEDDTGKQNSMCEISCSHGSECEILCHVVW